MKRLALLTSTLAALTTFGCVAVTDSGETPDNEHGALSGGKSTKHVCGDVGPGDVRCHAHVVVDKKGEPDVTSGPTGYGPADLAAAYELPGGTAGSGQTVAVIDAYDYPNAEKDLGVYRAQFGLPPCTTANGCFKKVNQNGQTTGLPRADAGWSQEAALDIEMVSAVCPSCKILLVEARTASMTDLGTAVNTAVALGATVVSNSYGGGESSAEASSWDGAYFNHPGVMITVSSGDSGYGVQYPAASRFVTAVGGTSLRRASSTRGFAETAWSGAGSGCSAYVAKPSWQKDTGCARRSVADVAAVADPNTGVSVYWTSKGRGGWMVFGGTSVAAPVVAGVYALAGNGSTLTYGSAPYAHASALFDVTSGSNGTCSAAYLCTSGAGYDGPTGLGTPNGAGAF